MTQTEFLQQTMSQKTLTQIQANFGEKMQLLPTDSLYERGFKEGYNLALSSVPLEQVSQQLHRA